MYKNVSKVVDRLIFIESTQNSCAHLKLKNFSVSFEFNKKNRLLSLTHCNYRSLSLSLLYSTHAYAVLNFHFCLPSLSFCAYQSNQSIYRSVSQSIALNLCLSLTLSVSLCSFICLSFVSLLHNYCLSILELNS